ncbi:hypothetical protein RFI_15919 [Reticulomyxa filosa]|uniref:Beta-adaptin appendage C-terminal subdomain domain-containing protein n=1 Tax=Reticulomyxa filosa TaxID=46433 RepID=X6N5J0_RETFI|nr:hypothetical protein RFI_15919 [Reticulomyxa filosa]|eukprot:ETO21281.1 hypothetical protein RFI_15919 [Reticulomyxa filosa]
MDKFSGQQSINRVDIKFNVNYLGIEPTQTLPLNGLISFGSSQLAELPLVLSGEPQQRTPLNTKVQVAVRAAFVNSNEKAIFKFDTTIPSHIFFETLAIDKNDYLEKWKNIQQSDGQSVQLKPAKTPDIEAIKTHLGRHNCIFISPREVSILFYYFILYYYYYYHYYNFF